MEGKNEKAEDFVNRIESERKQTRKEFDLLVIKRFKEMAEESSDPTMFHNLNEDIEKLKETRKLIN